MKLLEKIEVLARGGDRRSSPQAFVCEDLGNYSLWLAVLISGEQQKFQTAEVRTREANPITVEHS